MGKIIHHPTTAPQAESASVLTARIVLLWGQLRQRDEAQALTLAQQLPALAPRKGGAGAQRGARKPETSIEELRARVRPAPEHVRARLAGMCLTSDGLQPLPVPAIRPPAPRITPKGFMLEWRRARRHQHAGQEYELPYNGSQGWLDSYAARGRPVLQLADPNDPNGRPIHRVIVDGDSPQPATVAHACRYAWAFPPKPPGPGE